MRGRLNLLKRLGHPAQYVTAELRLDLWSGVGGPTSKGTVSDKEIADATLAWVKHELEAWARGRAA
jgi:hypothetical protein